MTNATLFATILRPVAYTLKPAFHDVDFRNWNQYEKRQRLLHADDNHNGNRQSMFHDGDFIDDFSCRFS